MAGNTPYRESIIAAKVAQTSISKIGFSQLFEGRNISGLHIAERTEIGTKDKHRNVIG